jgi:ubiquinone biosynthesis protein COQ9
MDHETTMETTKARILTAAEGHAAFEGWSAATLKAALAESQTDPGLGHALFPRGGLDLAVAYHQKGDRAMQAALAAQDLDALRYSARVALAIRLRLEAADKELVRRGSALFSLPQHAAEGAKLIWSTADAIWRALGDTSTDINYYSKRTSLSAVYGATVLYWLGDQSEGNTETWAFLDRRIENIMQFEKAKAAVRKNPLAKALLQGPLRFLGRINAPAPQNDLPGSQK